MKSVGFTHYLPIEDTNSFLDVELDKPHPQGHDILAAVQAIAVNSVDTKARGSKNKVEETLRVNSYDASGVVEAVAPKSRSSNVGDEVYYAGDIMRSGTNQELHLMDERIVGHKPKSLSCVSRCFAADHDLLSYVGEEIDGGRIHTTVSQVLSSINAANLREAHRLFETRKAKDKSVVEQF